MDLGVFFCGVYFTPGSSVHSEAALEGSFHFGLEGFPELSAVSHLKDTGMDPLLLRCSSNQCEL